LGTIVPVLSSYQLSRVPRSGSQNAAIFNTRRWRSYVPAPF